MKKKPQFPAPDQRAPILDRVGKLKMARSPHRFVRGSTVKFYDWLQERGAGALPEGPAAWICGDCHVGNLGPVANAAGRIEIQIRDLDQTVIGNPAHDLVRLGLSLASAARGSDLPGVATARMLEEMMVGYAMAFEPDFDVESDLATPKSIAAAIRQSAAASWRTLATERIDDPATVIPLGRRFWPVSEVEARDIAALFAQDEIRRLATMLRSRDDDAEVDLLDEAYWMKGCSSLGRLRYAVLLGVGRNGKTRTGKTTTGKVKTRRDYCLMDVKEAVEAAAPHAAGADMPNDQAARVVKGAAHLSPHLGRRMRAAAIQDKPVFVRELLPQDLKLEIDRIPRAEATKVAGYLAAVVGKAHSRQMDSPTRKAWLAELGRDRTRLLDAPGWLWTSIVDLLVSHERAYLEHCRRYALAESV